jgi:hypothetical protein
VKKPVSLRERRKKGQLTETFTAHRVHTRSTNKERKDDAERDGHARFFAGSLDAGYHALVVLVWVIHPSVYLSSVVVRSIGSVHPPVLLSLTTVGWRDNNSNPTQHDEALRHASATTASMIFVVAQPFFVSSLLLCCTFNVFSLLRAALKKPTRNKRTHSKVRTYYEQTANRGVITGWGSNPISFAPFFAFLFILHWQKLVSIQDTSITSASS